MVDLGIPSAPPPTLAPRRKTKQLKVGSVGVGSDSPVSVQSMCTHQLEHDHMMDKKQFLIYVGAN